MWSDPSQPLDRLEKVTFEDGLGSIGECIICIEEFEGGLELIRLPCSHVLSSGWRRVASVPSAATHCPLSIEMGKDYNLLPSFF
jgi:hypothetical protein